MSVTNEPRSGSPYEQITPPPSPGGPSKTLKDKNVTYIAERWLALSKKSPGEDYSIELRPATADKPSAIALKKLNAAAESDNWFTTTFSSIFSRPASPPPTGENRQQVLTDVYNQMKEIPGTSKEDSLFAAIKFYGYLVNLNDPSLETLKDLVFSDIIKDLYPLKEEDTQSALKVIAMGNLYLSKVESREASDLKRILENENIGTLDERINALQSIPDLKIRTECLAKLYQSEPEALKAFVDSLTQLLPINPELVAKLIEKNNLTSKDPQILGLLDVAKNHAAYKNSISTQVNKSEAVETPFAKIEETTDYETSIEHSNTPLAKNLITDKERTAYQINGETFQRGHGDEMIEAFVLACGDKATRTSQFFNQFMRTEPLIELMNEDTSLTAVNTMPHIVPMNLTVNAKGLTAVAHSVIKETSREKTELYGYHILSYKIEIVGNEVKETLYHTRLPLKTLIGKNNLPICDHTTAITPLEHLVIEAAAKKING